MVRYWYVVFVGRQPGVYHTWLECEEQITEFSKPKFRKFNSLEEAMFHYNEFMRSGVLPPPRRQYGGGDHEFRDEGSSSTPSQGDQQPQHPQERVASIPHTIGHESRLAAFAPSVPVYVAGHVFPTHPLPYYGPAPSFQHANNDWSFDRILLYALALLSIAFLMKLVMFS